MDSFPESETVELLLELETGSETSLNRSNASSTLKSGRKRENSRSSNTDTVSNRKNSENSIKSLQNSKSEEDVALLES